MNITNATTATTTVTITPADLGGTLGRAASDEQAEALWHFVDQLGANDPMRSRQLLFILNHWSPERRAYIAGILSMLTFDEVNP